MAADAASVKISGLITDQENEPLEFVSVKIAGTALGTTSGLDGRYAISVPESDTIRVVFSCIGFEESRRRLIEPKGEKTENAMPVVQPQRYRQLIEKRLAEADRLRLDPAFVRQFLAVLHEESVRQQIERDSSPTDNF